MTIDNITEEFDLIDQQNFESFQNQLHLDSEFKQNSKPNNQTIELGDSNKNENQKSKPKRPKI